LTPLVYVVLSRQDGLPMPALLDLVMLSDRVQIIDYRNERTCDDWSLSTKTRTGHSAHPTEKPAKADLLPVRWPSSRRRVRICTGATLDP
jgi:hypothetical protein